MCTQIRIQLWTCVRRAASKHRMPLAELVHLHFKTSKTGQLGFQLWVATLGRKKKQGMSWRNWPHGPSSLLPLAVWLSAAKLWWATGALGFAELVFEPTLHKAVGIVSLGVWTDLKTRISLLSFSDLFKEGCSPARCSFSLVNKCYYYWFYVFIFKIIKSQHWSWNHLFCFVQ